jgi:hypothetical protein
MGAAAQLAVDSCSPANFAKGLIQATKVALESTGKQTLPALDGLLLRMLAGIKLVAVA